MILLKSLNPSSQVNNIETNHRNSLLYIGSIEVTRTSINLSNPTRKNTLITSVIARLIMIDTTVEDKLYKP